MAMPWAVALLAGWLGACHNTPVSPPVGPAVAFLGWPWYGWPCRVVAAAVARLRVVDLGVGTVGLAAWPCRGPLRCWPVSGRP